VLGEKHLFLKNGSEIFCAEGWIGEIRLRLLAKIAIWRERGLDSQSPIEGSGIVEAQGHQVRPAHGSRYEPAPTHSRALRCRETVTTTSRARRRFSGVATANRSLSATFGRNEIASTRSASARIFIMREISSNGSSTRSSNVDASLTRF